MSPVVMLMLSSVKGEVGKLLGAKWKELDEEEKKVRPHPSLVSSIQSNRSIQPYIDQAAKDKTRAEEEKAAYDVRIHTIPSFVRTEQFFNATG
jgi:hypothetical protein